MTKQIVAKGLRGAFTAVSLATILVATPATAHAGLWSWWQSIFGTQPSWWSYRPTSTATPEIDPGLARSAAAVVAGGLIVLRSRKKRQG